MKCSYILLLTFLFLSCKEQTKLKDEKVIVKENSLFNGFSEPNSDTVFIDYFTNKKKLEILTYLPDTCFTSWGWDKKERIELYESIKTKGYYLDTTPDFLNINSVRNNHFGCQVVDGYWEFALYRIKENNYIVVTNDVVGDGNSINIYEFKDNNLTAIQNRDGFFAKPLNELKLLSTDKNCVLKVEEENEESLFRYNFENINEVEINNAWGFTKNEYSNCLKGNTLKYKFDPNKRAFVLYEIKWNKKDYLKP